MTPAAAHEAPRVLVVDDEDGVRTALRGLLEELDLSVVGEARDGFEAVELTRTLEPDVVLMDIRMPGMGGIDAARSISVGLSPVQVVILTAYDDPAIAEATDSAGAFAYLIKGCSGMLIRDVIVQAWERKVGLSERAEGRGSPS